LQDTACESGEKIVGWTIQRYSSKWQSKSCAKSGWILHSLINWSQIVGCLPTWKIVAIDWIIIKNTESTSLI